jgi:ribosomal protein S18 acetylase RimI-like enzyme
MLFLATGPGGGDSRHVAARAHGYHRRVTDDVVIRRAEPGDVREVARLAGALVRMHHAVDPARFLLVDDVERGYGQWLSRELANAGAVVLVARRGASVLGYSYASLSARDWNLLLDEHGAIHDVFVADPARRKGIGKKLVEETIAALEQLGAQRIVLSTMVDNEPAQRLFRACGFRPTMIEMTR